jgi:hypothetical protein
MSDDPFSKAKHKTTIVPKMYEWGLFFWQLPDGHLFHDGNGNMLNIKASSMYDFDAMKKLKNAAAHYGQPEGKPWFQAGIRRASDDEHSEQVDRLKEGLIPSVNDLGALAAAQAAMRKNGHNEY